MKTKNLIASSVLPPLLIHQPGLNQKQFFKTTVADKSELIYLRKRSQIFRVTVKIFRIFAGKQS